MFSFSFSSYYYFLILFVIIFIYQKRRLLFLESTRTLGRMHRSYENGWWRPFGNSARKRKLRSLFRNLYFWYYIFYIHVSCCFLWYFIWMCTSFYACNMLFKPSCVLRAQFFHSETFCCFFFYFRSLSLFQFSLFFSLNILNILLKSW